MLLIQRACKWNGNNWSINCLPIDSSDGNLNATTQQGDLDVYVSQLGIVNLLTQEGEMLHWCQNYTFNLIAYLESGSQFSFGHKQPARCVYWQVISWIYLIWGLLYLHFECSVIGRNGEQSIVSVWWAINAGPVSDIYIFLKSIWALSSTIKNTIKPCKWKKLLMLETWAKHKVLENLESASISGGNAQTMFWAMTLPQTLLQIVKT